MCTKNTSANWDLIDQLLYSRFNNQNVDSVSHLERHVDIKTIETAIAGNILEKSVDQYGRDVYVLTTMGIQRRDSLLR